MLSFNLSYKYFYGNVTLFPREYSALNPQQVSLGITQALIWEFIECIRLNLALSAGDSLPNSGYVWDFSC